MCNFISYSLLCDNDKILICVSSQLIFFCPQENVKKQFDERQEQVKEMMNAMKARFAETLKDKEEIFNRRVQKAEKAKDRGE